MILINAIDANDVLIESQLDGSVYNIGLSWNEEGQFWSMSIRDLNFSVMAAGIPIIHNWFLLAPIRRPEFPTGDFMVDAAPNAKIGRKSFVDGTAALYYFPLQEILDASL